MRSGLALVVLIAMGMLVPSAAAVSGEMRVLYVIATWGPTPFAQDEVERVAVGTEAFFDAASGGRFSVESEIVPLRLPRAVFDSCDATALRNAAPPTMFAGYDRIAFVTPPVATCGFAGEANPTEVLLNGQLFMALAAHELGHTLGLGHASRWDCVGRSCQIDEYGNGFSIMGSGEGDLNAYEKSTLEWLTGAVRPDGRATYEIGPVDAPTTLPQALVVTTAASEFWFESRSRTTPSYFGGSDQPAGVAVVAGPAPEGEPSPYPRPNLLLASPSGRGRFAYAAGEAFLQPGVFRVVVERHAPESAALRLEWLDRIAPTRPRLSARAGRGRVRLTWESAVERGSGVDTYTVLVDGRARRTLRQQFPFSGWRTTIALAPGRHRIVVYAIDRAGNRGQAASARVRVT
jgi:hypothetical protein